MTLRRSLASLALVLAPGAAHAAVSTPFPGVTLVNDGSRVMAVANLCADGVSVRATRYSERKATPEGWAGVVGADVAINADFFDFPGWSMVVGRARGAGEDWPADKQNKEDRSYWQFGPGLADLVAPASIAPDAKATEIVGSHNVIIRDGKSLAPGFDGDAVILGAYRRTGVGMNGSRSKLYLFASSAALDGGAMAAAMFQLAAEAGAPDLDIATNEDGGGSSQLFVRGQGQLITSGRLVNNHLGVLAKGSGGAPSCWRRPPTFPLPPPAGQCGVVSAGEGLGPRQVVSSCDGRFSLIQQADGNLVLYGPVGKALWATHTQGVDGYALLMQTDGNAVQYSAYGRAAWTASTPGHPGARLVVQTDGNLVVYDGPTALWSSQTFATADMPAQPTQPAPAPASAPCGELRAGEGLALGQAVTSCDGRFTLRMQTDGNAVLYTLDGKALWASGTVAAVGHTLTMGPDGNLAVATPYQITAWASDTAGHPGARLAVQTDGNLVVYDGPTALWNSGTVAPDAPYPPPAQGGASGGGGQSAGGQGEGGQAPGGQSGAGAQGGAPAAAGAGGQDGAGARGGMSGSSGQGGRGGASPSATVTGGEGGSESGCQASARPGTGWAALAAVAALAALAGRRRVASGAAGAAR